MLENQFKKLITIQKLQKLKRKFVTKFVTTIEFKKLMKENFHERLKQANLARKSDTSEFTKTPDLDRKLRKIDKKITSNKSKHVEAVKKLQRSYNFLHKTNKLSIKRS